MGKDLKGKELGVGITQQKDGLYNASFIDKLGKRQVRRFKKLQECRRWLEGAKFTNEHSSITEANYMTVDAWFDYWISVKEKTVRPNTTRNLKERYEANIRKVIGNVLLVDVKPLHCQKIFTDMVEEGYSTSTMYLTRYALFNMLEFATENDVITNNPCRKSVKSNNGRTSSKKQALTVSEQQALLKHMDGHRYENQFKFILQTGLRTGELSGLKWEDVDFVKKSLTVNRSAEYRSVFGAWNVGEPKSKSGYRTIPLTTEAIRILYDQKSKNSKLKIIPIEWTGYVFINDKGMPVRNNAYDSALRLCCANASIKSISMHILRHTFATRCIEGGMKPKTLQKILGHSNIGITMDRYVTTTEDEKLKEIELVSDALLCKAL